MFKKFTKESVVGSNIVKSSVQRGIRSSILEQYPSLEPIAEEIFPKKDNITVTKCADHINLIVVNKTPLFYNERDGPYYPTLRLLHQYPDILPHLQVDRGAIKYVMSGANIMCPGLTSPGASMPNDVPAHTIVAIHAEDKQHALAIGVTEMSTKDIKKINKGIGVNNIHFLNDGLWTIEKIE
eukprot:TRINITY_DN8175_c0_g1_i2.p1 TRINITY_DN8175_c0_g1~~TRINITY_DN8175_c0_g1_i2.p1  ORF type:complete len:182 (+),score=21.95 TRINITY_DN8175_c0_g1_i2:48-593(+)